MEGSTEKGVKRMAIAEFFKTIGEAERWASYDMKHCITDVYGVDKPGTVRKFHEWQDDAIACGRHHAVNAKAVVVVYR